MNNPQVPKDVSRPVDRQSKYGGCRIIEFLLHAIKFMPKKIFFAHMQCIALVQHAEVWQEGTTLSYLGEVG